jgi:hypothetical protein
MGSYGVNPRRGIMFSKAIIKAETKEPPPGEV